MVMPSKVVSLGCCWSGACGGLKHRRDAHAALKRRTGHLAGIQIEGLGEGPAVGGRHGVGSDDVVDLVVGVAAEEIREHGLDAHEVTAQLERLFPHHLRGVTDGAVAIRRGGNRDRGRIETSADLELQPVVGFVKGNFGNGEGFTVWRHYTCRVGDDGDDHREEDRPAGLHDVEVLALNLVGQDDGANGDEKNDTGHEEGDEAALQAQKETDEKTDATDRGKDGREREAFVRSRNSGLCSNRSRCRRFGLDRRGCRGCRCLFFAGGLGGGVGFVKQSTHGMTSVITSRSWAYEGDGKRASRGRGCCTCVRDPGRLPSTRGRLPLLRSEAGSYLPWLQPRRPWRGSERPRSLGGTHRGRRW